MNKQLKYVDLPDRLRGRSLRPVLSAIAKTWFLIFTVITVCSLHPTAGLWVLGAAAIGVLQYHLNILGHDGIHYNLSADRRLNEFLSRWLLLAPQGLPLGAMRQSHLSHHALLGEPGDLDRHYYDLAQYESRGRFIRWILEAPLGGVLITLLRKLRHPSMEALGEKRHRQESSSDLLSVIFAQVLMTLILWFATAIPWAYFPLWALPLVTVMVGLNSIRSCLEHADLPKTRPPHLDYSFLSSRLENFFLAPFNMNHHAEHHRFVGIPFYQLPALRELLLRDNGPDIRWESSYWSRLHYLWKNFNSDFSSGRAPHAQALEKTAG